MFIKKKDYKYEFLPSNLEIIEKPPSPLGATIIIIIAIAVIVLIFLSFIFQIDEIISTNGTIEVEGDIQVVNTDSTSKIIEICKTEGDIVKQGDIILKLEDENIESIDSISKQIEQNQLKLLVLNSQINNQRDDSIFDNNKLDENIINEFKLEYDIYWNQRAEKEQKHIKEVSKLNDEMNDSSLSEEKRAEILEEINEKNNNYSLQNDTSLLSLWNEYNQIVESNNQLQINLTKLQKESENKLVKASVDGTLLTLNYNTVNSYVSPSTNIAEIVPANSKYIVKSKVANRYISKIKEGQKVVIKIDAYDYQIYGGFEGKISKISPSSVMNDEKNSLEYNIEVTLDNISEKIELKHGMTVSLDIKIDKKRIIEYIFDPIRKTVNEAF